MAYQINLTGQEIDERLQNIGTAEDVAAADGTLYARISKNADDVDELRDTVGHIDSAQTATDKTVTQHTVDISALQRALKTKANLANGKVPANELPVATSLVNPNNGTIPSTFAVSKAINDKIVGLLHWQGVKDTTDEIKDIALAKKGDVWHSNGDGSEWVCTEDISTVNDSAWTELGTPIDLGGYYTKNEVDKKVKPLADSIGTAEDAAAADGTLYARISKNADDVDELRDTVGHIDSAQTATNKTVTQHTKDIRALQTAVGNVVYDGCFSGVSWLEHKKGSQFDIVFFGDEKRFPMPGDPVASTGETYGAVVAVKEKPTATIITYNILWTNGVALYEIGIEERVESDEYVYICTSPAKKLCDDIYDYASKMSSGTLRDLYISAGAVYNEQTGFYELNGLTDITENEMRTIYNRYLIDIGTNGRASGWLTLESRTNLPCMMRAGIFKEIDNSIYGPNVEVLRICDASSEDYNRVCYIEETAAVAHLPIPKLKKVIGIWRYTNDNPSKYNFSYGQPFSKCPLLEEIRMERINKSHTFAVSPNLSKESVLYMITNANPPSGAAVGSIAITLHPTAYARLKDDADIVAALEAKGGIVTLVSA